MCKCQQSFHNSQYWSIGIMAAATAAAAATTWMGGTKQKKLVVALLGPPGSGKGSYGRHLAKALKYSLVGMSDVLREMRQDLDLSSGRLIDDTVVTNSLHRYLEHHHQDHSSERVAVTTHGYLLDGFPRTIRQLNGDDDDSATVVPVDAAIQLAVPDLVCEAKLLGRRLCEKCGGNFNVTGVDQDGWKLPPTLPTNPACSQYTCPWERRSDDQPQVVQHRLQVYHEHMDPIVKYFGDNDQLLKLTPYHGFHELPQMIDQVKDFLKQRRPD